MSHVSELRAVQEKARSLGREMVLRWVSPGATEIDAVQGEAAVAVLVYAEKRSTLVDAGLLWTAISLGLCSDEPQSLLEDAVDWDRLSHWPDALRSLESMERDRESITMIREVV